MYVQIYQVDINDLKTKRNLRRVFFKSLDKVTDFIIKKLEWNRNTDIFKEYFKKVMAEQDYFNIIGVDFELIVEEHILEV